MEPTDHLECERQLELALQETGRLRVHAAELEAENRDLTESNDVAAESIIRRGVQASTIAENDRLRREISRLENELVKVRSEQTDVRRAQSMGADIR